MHLDLSLVTAIPCSVMSSLAAPNPEENQDSTDRLLKEKLTLANTLLHVQTTTTVHSESITILFS